MLTSSMTAYLGCDGHYAGTGNSNSCSPTQFWMNEDWYEKDKCRTKKNLSFLLRTSGYQYLCLKIYEFCHLEEMLTFESEGIMCYRQSCKGVWHFSVERGRLGSWKKRSVTVCVCCGVVVLWQERLKWTRVRHWKVSTENMDVLPRAE